MRNPIIWLARWRARRAYRRDRQRRLADIGLGIEVLESMWRSDRQDARASEGDEFEAAARRCNTVRSGDDFLYHFLGAGRLGRVWRRNPDDYL